MAELETVVPWQQGIWVHGADKKLSALVHCLYEPHARARAELVPSLHLAEAALS